MQFKKLSNQEFNTLVKCFCVFAVLYFLSSLAWASPHPIKIAVIDTGFDFKSDWRNQFHLRKPKLCPDGHKSFAGSLQDTHGHGTHIAGLIGQGNENADYCLIIIKFFDSSSSSADNLTNSIKAYEYAISLDVDIINYSGGGIEFSALECRIVQQALARGIRFVAAAGNEHSDLTRHPYYPALCASEVYKIAATTRDNKRLPASNYTTSTIPNLYEELGENVQSIVPNNHTGIMTGTSQATAIFTQKLVRKLHQYRIEQLMILNRTA